MNASRTSLAKNHAHQTASRQAAAHRSGSSALQEGACPELISMLVSTYGRAGPTYCARSGKRSTDRYCEEWPAQRLPSLCSSVHFTSISRGGHLLHLDLPAILHVLLLQAQAHHLLMCHTYCTCATHTLRSNSTTFVTVLKHRRLLASKTITLLARSGFIPSHRRNCPHKSRF